MRQSRVSMERIKAAANLRLMRLAQKMIVGGALLLDRVANSHLHHLGVIAESVPNRTLSGIEEGGRGFRSGRNPSLSGSDGKT